MTDKQKAEGTLFCADDAAGDEMGCEAWSDIMSKIKYAEKSPHTPPANRTRGWDSRRGVCRAPRPAASSSHFPGGPTLSALSPSRMEQQLGAARVWVSCSGFICKSIICVGPAPLVSIHVH